MASDIGTKIGVEGEAEFRKALQNIDGSLKTLKAEMGAVTAEFIGNEKSVEALTKQNDVLKRTSDELKKKLAEQESQLAKVKVEYGENSTAAQKLQTDIYKTTADLNKNEAQIRQNEKALKDMRISASDVADVLKNVGEVLAKGVVAAFTAVTAAATAATAAIAKGVSDLAAYGDKIDKNSQKIGISAEAYQEWDFVLQHAGSSAEALATPMKTLVNAAYDGKDAFEKLGISQEELQTLSPEKLFARTISALQDVTDETDRFGIASDLLGKGAQELGPLLNMSADETENMRKAVHDLGGVLSDEAVKASAEFEDNLLDLKTAFSGAKNGILSDFLPSVNKAMVGLRKILSGEGGGFEDLSAGIDEFFSNLTQKLPELIKKLLPVVTQAVLTIVKGLSAALPDVIDTIAGMLPDVINGIVSVLPTLTSALVEGLVTLINSLTDNMDTIIPALIDGILGMVDALTDPGNLKAILVGIVRLAVALVVELGKKLPEIAVHLLTAIGNIAIALWEAVKEVFAPAADWFGELFGGAIERIKAVFSPIIELFAAVWDKIKGVFSAVADFFGNAFESAKNTAQKKFEGIKSFMGEVWGNIKQTLAPVVDWIGARFGEAYEYAKKKFEPIKDAMAASWENIKATFAPVGEWFSENFGWAVDGIKKAFDGIKKWAEGIWNDIKDAFKTGDFLTIGKNIVEGLWNGIKGAWDWLKKQVAGLIDGLIGGVKDMLGIHSPSKVFEEIGTDTIEGFEIGFTNRFSKFEKKAVEKVEDFTFFVKKEFDKLASYRGNAYAAWAMEQESLSWEESTKRTNEAAKEIRRIAEEMADYDRDKKVIERGGVRWIIEGNTLRKADFGDLSEFAFKPLFEETIEEAAEEMAEAITEVVKEVFIPENINNMTKEDFRRWREDGFATAETVVSAPVTSAPVTGSGTTGSGALDQVLAAIRDLPTIPERIIVETNIDGERVATAIWNPLNAVAEQKGQPIINPA